jgi:hypothetical protein
MVGRRKQRVTSESVFEKPWDKNSDEQRDRKRTQVDRIRKTLESKGSRIGVHFSHKGTDDLADVDYMFRRRTVLCDDTKAAEVRDFLGIPPTTGKRTEGLPPPIDGMTAILVPDKGKFRDDDAMFDALDANFGPGAATPDHVIHVTDTGNCCPASEPRPVVQQRPIPQPMPKPKSPHPVKVVVMDSGLMADVVADHDWLTGVTGDPNQQPIDPYGPHGTFVAGVVRTMAPSADVYVNALMFAGGAVLDTVFAYELTQVMKGSPDIISMSAGTTTRNAGILKGLDTFYRQYLSKSTTILVCAAGNDGVNENFYPAYLDWTVAVGALDETSTARAGFSNFGAWVDVFAQGTNVINAYPKIKDYEYTEDMSATLTDFSNGMAAWDGTSFSTPMVSGMIAGRMSWSGENATQAWKVLSQRALQRQIPGVGPVLLPGDQNPP